jgi:hypothetical protein
MATVLPLWSGRNDISSKDFNIANFSAWLFVQQLPNLYLHRFINSWYSHIAAPAPTFSPVLLPSVNITLQYSVDSRGSIQFGLKAG